MTEYDYTKTKDDVEVPHWAESIEIGDVLELTAPWVEESFESEVIGFSTLFNGEPVVEAPYNQADKPREHIETCIVERDNLVDYADGKKEVNWIGLECPVCGQTTFDGQGHDSQGRYIHRCADCNTQIRTTGTFEGQKIGTTNPEDPRVNQ